MAATVDLPAVGPVSRRALFLGGGLSLVVVGIVWWRRRQAAAAAVPVDPNAEDLAGVDSGVADDGSGTGAAGGGAGGAGATSTDTVRSNPQWSALVIQSLGGVVDPALLAQAIGLYLTGSAVTHDQELIIDQAIAFAGLPPVAGPAGYPPAIRQSPATGQTGPPVTTKHVNVQHGWYVDVWLADLRSGKEGPVAAATSEPDIVRLNGAAYTSNIVMDHGRRRFRADRSYTVGK